MAKARNLDIIAITDHNTTLHGPIVRKLAEPLGITVFFGAEVTTREETHCLCLFQTEEQRLSFQYFLNNNFSDIPNEPTRFGYQVQVNEEDQIVYEEPRLLIAALKVGINQVEQEVHRSGGLFIPAHIDRPMYSLTSQLGFVPPNLKFDALEISRHTSIDAYLSKNSYLKGATLIKNSDAHYPEHIGQNFTSYVMEYPSIEELSMALRCEKERHTITSL
jgi:hypothetical protein